MAAPAISNLVGYKHFVRANPHSDRFPVLGFHHVEFYTTDAASAAGRFSFSLGLPLAAHSDISTGNSAHSSLLLRSHSLAFLFTAPNTSPLADAASRSIPSFDADAATGFIRAHGLAVRAVALRVADARAAFDISVANGARPAFAPADLGLGFSLSEVELYGDVRLRYVSYSDEGDENGAKKPSFLPGFVDVARPEDPKLDYGLRRLDHAVGNVPEILPVAKYIAGFTGFHEFAEFTAEDVGTAESGLNSLVLANNAETVLTPLNEPVHGTKLRSQIQTYLDHHGGSGVQHLALASDDVLRTLREMRKASAMGGFDFHAAPPPTYYDGVRQRAGHVLSEEQIQECERLGVLVDRDDQGVLLQIFTKPVGDRPTLFLEIIQRVGCMMKDDEGVEYQKGGCGGFGKGNFSALFKSIEEYEKALDAKRSGVVSAA